MKGERDASPGERGMRVEPEQFLHPERDRGAAFAAVVDRRLGSRSAQGNASALRLSRRRLRSQGSIASSALARSSAPISSSLVLPMRNGASHAGSALSASSERSGHAPLPAWARNITRSRRCFSALVHGRRATPSDRTPRASASAAVSSCGMGSVCSARVSALKRRRRRARNDAEAAVEAEFVPCLDRGAGDPLDVVERERGGQENSRRGSAAGDFPNGEKRLAGERIMRLERRRPAIGHEKFAAPATRDRDAVGIGGGEQRRALDPRPLSLEGEAEGEAPLPWGEGGRRPDESLRPRRQSAREAPRVVGPLRTVAPKSFDPGREIDGVSAQSAFGQDDRDFASRFCLRPSRAASMTMRARRGGSARLAIARPSSVMRPSPSMAPIDAKSARASCSAARGGESRNASLLASVTPQSAQSSVSPERSAERISGAA